jgi:NADH-quinone oxidoreductase subunit E
VVEEVVARHPEGRSALIPVLQEIQERLGFLSPEALKEVQRLTGISANESYGVATFYTQFRFTPPGKHVIHACQGTACHVRGGAQNMRELQKILGINPGEITPDTNFGLERVACLGCCALAPVVSVDGKAYARVSPKKLPAILDEYRQ